LIKSVDYVIQVLQALEYAHRRGVIHRDITPANVIIQADGTAKLMDFGLAKSERDIQITREGVAVGSVHYMSPEQVRGQQELDYRSDLYSTGAVLYELVAKQKVFDGSDGFAIMRAHVEKTPEPLTTWNKDCPPELDAAVRKALAKDPIQRFRSAAEFRVTLEKLKPILEESSSKRQEKKLDLERSITNVSNAMLGVKTRPSRTAIATVVVLTGLIAVSLTMFVTGTLLPEAEQTTEASEEVAPEPEPKKAPAKKSNIKRGPTKKAVQKEEDAPWAQ
jgi:serine/threonine protein kinase